MQIQGELTGFIPSFYETPTYNNEQTDFRLKVLVEDASEIVEKISLEYDRACEWWAHQTGRRAFFDAPFEMQTDGSAIIKMVAKLAYDEFPFPAVDSELNPLATDLIVKSGSKAIVHVEPAFHPKRAPKGGLRLRPLGVQVVEVVSSKGRDSGGMDINKMFKKQDGFKQSTPVVKELASVSTNEDPDF